MSKISRKAAKERPLGARGLTELILSEAAERIMAQQAENAPKEEALRRVMVDTADILTARYVSAETESKRRYSSS